MNTKIKILILDDSPDLLDALRIFLEYESCEVYTVGSKELLKTELKRRKPDIIILDVYIHGHADGRAICKIIKSDIETRHIPVLLMSVNKRGLERFEECQADAIIEKPFDLWNLLQKIRYLTRFNIKTTVITGNMDETHRLISLMIKNT